jgi:hypothetical protein
VCLLTKQVVTNMKADGLVGGQLQVISVDQAEGGQTGITTDIHFMVLSFTDGTGKVIMCAVILKSEKNQRYPGLLADWY